MSRPTPSGWLRTPLRDVTEEITERVGGCAKMLVLSSTKHRGLVPSEEYFRGRTIYSNDLSNYKIIRRDWLAYATNHLAEGSIGLLRDFDEACVSPIYTVFRCADSVYPPYLYRLLKTRGLINSYALHEQASVDRRGAVRYRDFSKIEITIPGTLREQRQITEILDTLDERISFTNKVLTKHKAAKGAIHQEMIPIRPDPGRLSKEWDLLPLADVVPTADYGISASLTLDADGTPTLRMNNLNGGRIVLGEVKRTTAAVPRKLMLKNEDVLFNRTNSIDHVGRTSVWREELQEATFASYLVRLNIDPARITAGYLGCWLNHPAVQQRIRRLATPGVQQVNINPTNLRRTLIELPVDLSQQQQIVEVLAEFDRTTDAMVAEISRLRLLRQGLVDDLLTGRVRIPGE